MRAGYAINGRYRIIRSLGEGGMANVYLAYDLILERDGIFISRSFLKYFRRRVADLYE